MLNVLAHTILRRAAKSIWSHLGRLRKALRRSFESAGLLRRLRTYCSSVFLWFGAANAAAVRQQLVHDAQGTLLDHRMTERQDEYGVRGNLC